MYNATKMILIYIQWECDEVMLIIMIENIFTRH